VVPAANVSQPDSSSADFVFEGSFEGMPVLWHCHLATLASIARKSRLSSQRQFIEIEPAARVQSSGDLPVMLVKVGLNVSVIDAAAIKKTTIMIRNYKRLHAGRHEYGERYEFTLE
jgi:hypothetical protein